MLQQQTLLSEAAAILGEKGGRSRSEAKKTAARENGVEGGRPMADPILNQDGVSVKGCNIIYAPKGQAGEYARLATNPYRGCGHACAYCYVPAVTRVTRADFDAGAFPRPHFLTLLRRDAQKYQMIGITEQVLLSFTTDPFNPFDISLTRPTIEILAEYGLAFTTLTKGGSRAIPFLDLYRPDRDAFASTLTSLDDRFSARWERRAQPPRDRIDTLRMFHDAGIFTWVSLEPVLDTKASLQIVRETSQFVDLYKIGRANYLPITYSTDWRQYTLQMVELCARLNVKAYVKRDLQPYLPPGFIQANVPQHR